MLHRNIRSIPLSLSARAAQILVIKSCGGHFEKCLGADGFCNKFDFESVFHLISSYYIKKISSHRDSEEKISTPYLYYGTSQMKSFDFTEKFLFTKKIRARLNKGSVQK